MKKLLYSTVIVIIVPLLVSMFSCAESTTTPIPSTEEPIVLKWAIQWAPNNSACDAVVWWGDEIEAGSDGRVISEYYWSQSLTKAADTIKALESGIADVGLISSSIMPGDIPLSGIGDLPCWTTSGWVIMKAYWDLMQTPDYQAEYGKFNMKVIGNWASGPYTYYGSKQIKTIGDMKGVKIRCRGDQAVLLDALGATPVSINMPEVYEALERRTIDGVLGGPILIPAYKHEEAAKYLTHIPLGFIATPMAMGGDIFNSLPEDVQEIIGELVHEQPLEHTRRYNAYDDRILEWLVDDMGWEISELSAADNAKIVQTANEVIWQNWAENQESKGLPGKTAVDKFLKFLSKWEPQVPKSYNWVESVYGGFRKE